MFHQKSILLRCRASHILDEANDHKISFFLHKNHSQDEWIASALNAINTHLPKNQPIDLILPPFATINKIIAAPDSHILFKNKTTKKHIQYLYPELTRQCCFSYKALNQTPNKIIVSFAKKNWLDQFYNTAFNLNLNLRTVYFPSLIHYPYKKSIIVDIDHSFTQILGFSENLDTFNQFSFNSAEELYTKINRVLGSSEINLKEKKILITGESTHLNERVIEDSRFEHETITTEPKIKVRRLIKIPSSKHSCPIFLNKYGKAAIVGLALANAILFYKNISLNKDITATLRKKSQLVGQIQPLKAQQTQLSELKVDIEHLKNQFTTLKQKADSPKNWVNILKLLESSLENETHLWINSIKPVKNNKQNHFFTGNNSPQSKEQNYLISGSLVTLNQNPRTKINLVLKKLKTTNISTKLLNLSTLNKPRTDFDFQLTIKDQA